MLKECFLAFQECSWSVFLRLNNTLVAHEENPRNAKEDPLLDCFPGGQGCSSFLPTKYTRETSLKTFLSGRDSKSHFEGAHTWSTIPKQSERVHVPMQCRVVDMNLYFSNTLVV